jgi:hypothetical protein
MLEKKMDRREVIKKIQEQPPADGDRSGYIEGNRP